MSVPDFGSTASAGRCTSLKTSSLVSLARSESLPFWSFALKPFEFVGTMKPRMLVPSASLSAVFAQTIATCAVEPWVWNEPKRTFYPARAERFAR